MHLIAVIEEFLTVILLFIILLIAFKRPKKTSLKLITIYVAVSLITNLIDGISDVIYYNGFLYGVSFSVQIVLEIFLINLFLFLKFKRTSFRMVTVFCTLPFLFIGFRFWILQPQYSTGFYPIEWGTEGIFISIPSLLLIFEILKSDFKTDLNSNPDFIIAAGLLFYFSLSVPIFFYLSNVFFDNNIHYTYLYLENLVDFFYIVLLLVLIKAYLCPIEISQD